MPRRGFGSAAAAPSGEWSGDEIAELFLKVAGKASDGGSAKTTKQDYGLHYTSIAERGMPPPSPSPPPPALVGLDGRRLPLAGRVSMDLAAVAAGPPGSFDGPKELLGREVLIFGRSPGLVIPIEELADAVGTIAYEILTGIGSRVERVIVES